MRLADIGEFGLIARLAEIIGGRAADASGVVIGVGDDAAAFQPTPGLLQVITTDMLVEGVHFQREWMSPHDLGWKTLAVNLSDCAAMAAEPRCALVCIALDEKTDPAYVLDLYAGMQELAVRFGVRIAGGDTVSSPSGLVLSVTLLGEVEPNRIVTRAGARPGDRILVTGTLGDSSAGCAALLAGSEVASRVPQSVVKAHCRPWPRVAEARAATAAGGVTALIDISDGLAGDLRHICEESGVGAEVLAQAIPLSPECCQAAQVLQRDPLDLALTGGEDYELLLTVSGEQVESVRAAITSLGTRVTEIGHILPEGVFLRRTDGTRLPLPAAGYQHFAP